MSLPHPENAKYQARIPSEDYGRHREKCTRLGLSFNEGLIEAVRYWLALADDAPPPPGHRKLSAVFREDLGAMEARLMAAIEALRPPACTVSVGGVDTIALGLGLPADQVGEDLASIPAFDLPAKLVSTRQGQSLAVVRARTEQLEGEIARVKGAFETIGNTKTRMYKATNVSVEFVQPDEQLTVPGGLEWDAPLLASQRLFPEQPPVNALAPQPLKGQVWAITGALDTMTKDHARERLMAAGATLTGAVNKRTSAVVFGNAANEEKLNRADELGVPVWSEQQLLAMLKYIEPFKEKQ